MNFINLKFLLLFIFFLNGVNSLTTEEEMAPILQQFQEKMFQEWENNYMKKIERKLADIPGMVTAIQGT